ncbi:unnamed protein product [Alternaria alternata]
MPSPASSDSEDDDDITPENVNHNSSRDVHESFTIAKNEPDWTDVKLADVSFSREARDKDWALVEGLQTHQIDSLDIGATNATIALGAIGERQSLQIGFDTEVALKCVLSPTPSMILTPSGHNFVQAHILTPDSSRRLLNGASGTWVTSQPAQVLDRNVNPISVYGQVVADDVFGDVYMIPLRCIMEDVKILMDAAVVRLPSSIKELRQILVAQMDREYTILDRGKSSKAPHSLSTNAAAERTNHGAPTGSIQGHSLVLESPSPLLSGKPKRSVLVRNPEGHVYVHKPEGHICTTCGRSYTRKEHLKRHERNHAQGDPLRCSQCTRTFHRRNLLERHEARHHESSSAETNNEDIYDLKKNGQPRQDNDDSILDRLGSYFASESASCDSCAASKVKCSKEYPICARCSVINSTCIYDVPSKRGKPGRTRKRNADERPRTPDVLTNGAPWPRRWRAPVALNEAPEAKKRRTEASWTPEENLCLKRMRSEGASWDRIMDIFPDRPESSVKKHWYKDLHHEGMAEDASASTSVPEQEE